MNLKQDQRRRMEIQMNAEKSVQEYSDTMKRIANKLGIIIKRGKIEQYREALITIFIDWQDKNIENGKKFKEEWDAILEK